MKSQVHSDRTSASVEVLPDRQGSKQAPTPSRERARSLLTVVVLTHNEILNIEHCLSSLQDLECPVFVVDSGSVDGTQKVASDLGAEVIEHPFESHARQWAWALDSLPIDSDWVLGLDADQRLTPESAEEIQGILGDARSSQVAGYFIKRRQIFRGKWIKWGGYYPKYLLKLFQREAVYLDENDLVDHHFHVRGKTARLKHDLIEDNRNERDISVWIEKHNRYAARQALEEFQGQASRNGRGKLFGDPDERVVWMKRRWARMPLFIRPLLYFVYRYFVRLGFLDGREGFVFHFLQGFWYRLLVDVHLWDYYHRAHREHRD